MTLSVIDGIAGLGPGRRQRLLKEVGSVKKLRELSEEDLLALTWLPDAVGTAVYRGCTGSTTPSDRATPPSAASATMDES